MPITATITKAQRDGIYELVCNHLYGIEDLRIALGRSRDLSSDTWAAVIAAPAQALDESVGSS